MRVPLLVSSVCLLAAAGCSSGSEQPSRAALGFATAVADGDGAAACSLLAPATHRELESSAGKPCAEAVLGQQLPTSVRVRAAERYGDEARVLLDRDTVFVARFSIGWRVVAAGCTDRGQEHPYDCTLKGG